MPDKNQLVDKLNAVLAHLKTSFVGKDDIIDLMGICLAGRENLFLLGPPGTAKSAMVRALANLLHGKTFEYLLTRFTEPNELFGPFDIRKLREGELVTNTEGMLPEANLIFLDELLNANSAILNSLLLILNERIFRRGRETRALPALMIVGASNHLPEDEALQALFDRFLLRVRCDYVDPALLPQVLQAGWQIERADAPVAPMIAYDELVALQQITAQVDLQPIIPTYLDLVRQLRQAGVPVSDRRAVKLQRLIAASALLCKRTTAIVTDLWVLRYIWDTEEQIELITGMVNTALEAGADEPGQHPRATARTGPDADALYREVVALSNRWDIPELPASERSIIKDRLRYLNGRSAWIANDTQRAYVQAPIEALWKKVLQQP